MLVSAETKPMPDVAAFLAIVLTALALIPGGAHALELANKMRLGQRDYFVAQSLYRGWQLVGFFAVGALGANIWAALLHRGAAFWLFAIAAGLIAATLVVFFVWTFPVNKATAMWTSQPANWRKLRTRWEYSHAANAAITFLALSCTALALVAANDQSPREITAAFER
jgi:hypothetical protein